MSGDLLVFRAGMRMCAVSVQHVEETMRPLPIEPLAGAPRFVLGASIVRGQPVPIVDAARLFSNASRPPARRIVTLRASRARRVGLLVGDVLGVYRDDALATTTLPPLLQDAATEGVRALARLDRQLLTILSAAALIPEALWPSLMDRASGP